MIHRISGPREAATKETSPKNNRLHRRTRFRAFEVANRPRVRGEPRRYSIESNERQRLKQNQRLSVLDLLAITALVALHFAISYLSVKLRDYGVIYFSLVYPTFLTALIQWRFGLAWRAATFAHYPIAVVWAFVFGVTFSFYWRKLPHDFFDRDTVGLEYPIGFGMLAVEAMLFIGVFSTMVYGCFAYWLFRAGNQDGE